jgi:hypothetical protein
LRAKIGFLKEVSSALNFQTPGGAGQNSTCILNAAKCTRFSFRKNVGIPYVAISAAPGAAFRIAARILIQFLLHIGRKSGDVFFDARGRVMVREKTPTRLCLSSLLMEERSTVPPDVLVCRTRHEHSRNEGALSRASARTKS